MHARFRAQARARRKLKAARSQHCLNNAYYEHRHTPDKVTTCELTSIDAIGPRDCAAMDRVLFGRHIELCTELLLRQVAVA